MLKQFLCFSSLLLMNVCIAQINIIPQPEQVSMSATTGSFTISPSTVIVANNTTKNSADFLNDYLKEVYGFMLKITDKKGASNAINLAVVTPTDTAVNGAYDMDVT